MSNDLYAKYRERVSRAQADWLAGQTRRVVLVTSTYVFDENHEYLNSVPAGARVAISDPLANPTAVNGYCGADAVRWNTLNGGAEVVAAVLYADTGNETTDYLIAFIDTAAGLPFTTHGGGLILNWSAAFDAIFRV